MKKQNEYNILLGASCLSILDEVDINQRLVASLYDIHTKEKISDGENEKFEILDYSFTSVTKNSKSIDVFIVNEIKSTILQIIDNNGYDKSLLNLELLIQISNSKNFKITGYEVSRLLTLEEIYFKIMQEPTKYDDMIEFITCCYNRQTCK